MIELDNNGNTKNFTIFNVGGRKHLTIGISELIAWRTNKLDTNKFELVMNGMIKTSISMPRDIFGVDLFVKKLWKATNSKTICGFETFSKDDLKEIITSYLLN